MVFIAICDDSKPAREDIKNHLISYSIKHKLEYLADEYESGECLLSSGKNYDLIFMDYEFEDKGSDGISIAKELRKKEKDTKIVFLSGYPEAVFDSFEVAAFRFLLKPIDDKKFSEMLDSFLSAMSDKDRMIQLRESGVSRFVREKDILCAEAFGKNCIIHLHDKKDDIICNETLASLEKRVDSNLFFRCHKSFLINLNHVNGYNYNCITLDNGEGVLISRKKYSTFVERYSDFIADGV